MIKGLREPPDSIPTTAIQWGSSWPKLASEDERHHLFSYLEDRFGISKKQFDVYLLFKRKQSWLLMGNVSHLTSAACLKVSKTGLKAFRKVGAFIKPTTRMIQCFGNTATKAKIEIDEGQLFKLLAGEEIPVDLDLEDGYVILALSMNRVLGFGFIYKGKVRSQLPRKELRHAMVQLSPTQY